MQKESMMRGVIPGVMAGYLFLAYAGGGMQDMIGGMINSNDFVGFILHIIFSAVIGALYTSIFLGVMKPDNPLMTVVVGGLIYGLIWWIVGGNLIMPLIAGGDVFAFEIGPSFYGHIIFGHALAFIVRVRDMAMDN